MNDTALPPRFSLPHELSGRSCESVLVALSGGADSTALLHMMSRYSAQYGTAVYAAHVNHMIRGKEADDDEQFCRELCSSLGIELFVLRRDVPLYARQSGLSIETAAREVRYGFFDELMEQHSIPLLATAHNANDNLETLIFNIARGSGLTGVCGIPVTRRARHGTVIRPILRMSKDEILAYCEQWGLSFVTDSTNTDTDYTRNKIRATVIPALTEINPNAVQNASRLTESLRSDALCLEGLTDMFLEQMADDASFELDKLLLSPAAVSNRAIMALYSQVSGGSSLESTHLSAIRQLCQAAVPHSAVDLPSGIIATIEQGRLHIIEKGAAPRPPESFCVGLCDGENTIPQINAEIIIGNSQKQKNIYKKSTLLYLDSAKICGMPTARERRAGDKIRIRGTNRSIKKLLCDKKIPLELRYRLPMICDGDTVIAIPFVAVADGYGASGSQDGALSVRFNLFE